MLGRKTKGKSNPINLVTPGDVVSTQQLLRVQQNSLVLFFTRTYNSYKCMTVLCALLLICSASCTWLGLSRRKYPEEKEFIGLLGTACVLALCEFVCRMGTQPLCDFAKEPLHWVDAAVLVLWYSSASLALCGWTKYYSLVLAVQVLFSCRTLLLCVRLFRRIHAARHYESPNLNVLNISQVPGEVEVIALDESGNNSQPSQLQQSSRNIVPDQKDIRVDKNFTYFSPKHAEAGQKLEVDE